MERLRFPALVLRTDVVQPADVRVLELRDRLGLPFESQLQMCVVREFGRQEFHGDTAVQPCVARFVHFAHAARADRRDDLIWTQTGSGTDGHDRVSDYGTPAGRRFVAVRDAGIRHRTPETLRIEARQESRSGAETWLARSARPPCPTDRGALPSAYTPSQSHTVLCRRFNRVH